MGFPSPARDYVEKGISLDSELISHPSATYFMRAAESHLRAGIAKGALLLVDSSITPCDGSVVVCRLSGEFHLRRLRLYPDRCLEHLENARREPIEDDGCEDDGIFGVVTHSINDMRNGEFDDNPAI